MNPRAFSFVRFSAPRLSASQRTPAATAFCLHRGLELDTTLRVREKRDMAVHRNSASERALEDFRERIRSGDVPKGSYLLLERLEMLNRARADTVATLLKQIVMAGVTIVPLPDGREITRAVVREAPSALVYVVAGFMYAHDETALKSRRMRDSWQWRRARAQLKEPVSGVCPAWLALDQATGTFRVNRQRARVVQRIYREALRGIGQSQITDALNEDAVAVFGRGARWHRSYVLKLLTNAAVIGTYVPHTAERVDGRRVRTPAGAAIPDYYPRIIEPEMFSQVQTLVTGSRSPLRGRHAKAGRVVNVFGGLAVCGRCGAPVTLVNKGKAPKTVRYLVCSAARVGAGCRQYEAIPYARFEGALVRERASLFARKPMTAQRADFDRLISEAESAAQSLTDSVDGAPMRARSNAIKAQRDKFLRVAQTLRAEREANAGSHQRDSVAALRTALGAEPLDRTHINALLRQVFSFVTVDYEGQDLSFQWRRGGQSEVDLGS